MDGKHRPIESPSQVNARYRN